MSNKAPISTNQGYGKAQQWPLCSECRPLHIFLLLLLDGVEKRSFWHPFADVRAMPENDEATTYNGKIQRLMKTNESFYVLTLRDITLKTGNCLLVGYGSGVDNSFG